MEHKRIKSVKPLEDHFLLVEFDDRSRRLYDVEPLFSREPFAFLRNPAFFRAVKVDTGGYAVYWNEEVDISEFEIWKNGRPVADQ
jgi:hypothetical protein